LNNRNIRRVIILGTLAIIGILAVQSYWVVNTWRLRSSEFDQKIQVALRQTAQGLANLNRTVLPSEDLIRQVSTDYYLVNINNVFEATDLEFFLKRELEELSIQDDFDYYIYDCGTDNMVYCNTVDYGAQRSEDIKANMPKSPDLIYYFGVRFPNRLGFVLNTLWLAIVFSGVLLFAIAFFAYAMIIILRQKRDSELQKDFINNMTHEFKTPISTIKISSDVIADHPIVKEDKRLQAYAEIIQEQNARLSSHVDKVLKVASIENEGLAMNLETVDLHAIINGSIEQIKAKLQEKNGSIYRPESPSSIEIKGDPYHLQNVFVNIFDNAIKYCKDTPQIQISLTQDKTDIKVAVQDNGIGIPESTQESLFDKFYRVPTGNLHDVKGFGLGLYYVKHICDQHNWTIDITSQPERGTTITFKIPK